MPGELLPGLGAQSQSQSHPHFYSCKRRGCAAICPNGSLITGQGTRSVATSLCRTKDSLYANRFVLADTERLHQKISEMSDRIRQLEDALATLQSSLSSEPHPLLSRDLMNIKSSIELHAAIEEDVKAQLARSEVDGRTSTAGDGDGENVIDAFGTLAIRDDGTSMFYGRSAGSEVSKHLRTEVGLIDVISSFTEFINCGFLSRLRYVSSHSDCGLGRKIRRLPRLSRCLLILFLPQLLSGTIRSPALSYSISQCIFSLQSEYLPPKLHRPN